MTADFLPVEDVARLRRRTSAKWQMHPGDVLPLPVAEMDFGVAEPIRAVLHEAIDRDDLGYAFPTRALGVAVAGFAERRWNWTVAPDDVRAVTDVKRGLIELARVLVRPGDQVIISPPCYPPFFDWLAGAGGRPIQVPLAHHADGSFTLDLVALEAAFRTGPGVYLLCNPQNPTGSLPSPQELTALAALADRYGIRVLSDEIHAPLVAPGQSFTPFLSVPGGAEVGISLMSASKAWNLAGLKCAVMIAGSDRGRAGLDRLDPDLRWDTGHLGVIATEAAFTHGDPYLDALLVTLADRRSYFHEQLTARLPDLELTPARATYFAWLDCRSVGPGGEPYRQFYERGRVALEPGPRFGADAGSGFVRLNLATSREIIADAVNRMASALI